MTNQNQKLPPHRSKFLSSKISPYIVVPILTLFSLAIIGLLIVKFTGICGESILCSKLEELGLYQKEGTTTVEDADYSKPEENEDKDGVKEVEIETEEKYKTYKYESEYFDPNFELQYPADMKEEFSEAPGGWDIALTRGNLEIKVDLSGEDYIDYEDVLSLFLNRWGSYDYQYEFQVLKEGNITKGNTERYYKLYLINLSDREVLMAIVNVTNISGSTGYLAIQVNDKSQQNVLTDILESIK